MMDDDIKEKILSFQRNEITEHAIYLRLASGMKNAHNREILTRIAQDELRHSLFWKSFTRVEVSPDAWKVWKYVLIAKVLGLTFGLKLLEKDEEDIQRAYAGLVTLIPNAREIEEDESRHEKELLDMIDEEKLKYIGSLVLGLNDALVELTGALAGLTLALQNTRLIAAAGLITGIAAAFSMAASEYLSTRSETPGNKSPAKAAIYTGTAYILTVAFLIFPFLVFDALYFSLGFSILNALIVIFVFTFYVSVAKDLPFRKRFLEMAGLSMGVAALTFVIGFAVRIFFNIEI